LGFRIEGFGFWVLGFGFWILGFGLWVWGVGIRVNSQHQQPYISAGEKFCTALRQVRGQT